MSHHGSYDLAGRRTKVFGKDGYSSPESFRVLGADGQSKLEKDLEAENLKSFNEAAVDVSVNAEVESSGQAVTVGVTPEIRVTRDSSWDEHERRSSGVIAIGDSNGTKSPEKNGKPIKKNGKSRSSSSSRLGAGIRDFFKSGWRKRGGSDAGDRRSDKDRKKKKRKKRRVSEGGDSDSSSCSSDGEMSERRNDNVTQNDVTPDGLDAMAALVMGGQCTCFS